MLLARRQTSDHSHGAHHGVLPQLACTPVGREERFSQRRPRRGGLLLPTGRLRRQSSSGSRLQAHQVTLRLEVGPAGMVQALRNLCGHHRLHRVSLRRLALHPTAGFRDGVPLAVRRRRRLDGILGDAASRSYH